MRFFSPDIITDNYLILVADTDKITNNRNQHLYAFSCTPESKEVKDVVGKYVFLYSIAVVKCYD